MALINCPECNKEISDKALSCPNCGLPLQNNTAPLKAEYRSRTRNGAPSRFGNGYGSITQVKGNLRKPFRVVVTSGWKFDEKAGRVKQVRKNLGYYETRKEALEALALYNKNPYDLDASKITFAEIFNKWSTEHYPKVSKSNIQGYNASYKLCTDIDNMVFADIRLAHLQGIIDTCGKNYPTLRKLKVLFNMMYGYAMKHDVCAKDYSEFIDIKKFKDQNPNKYDRKPFNQEEIDLLWKWKDTSIYFTVMLMLIYSGCRISELLDLKKENINLSERWFDVTASKTDSGIRKVPIADKVYPFYKYWYELNDCEYLLSTPEGGHFTYRNYYDSYWMPFIEQIGMTHKPHDTRHTCISLLAEAGIDDKVVKKIVGHKGQGVTEIVYTHFEIQTLIDAINII